MTSDSSLRLDQLSLRNFRCFTECAIELHPQLTVLVAENGFGKTAILNAIGIALGLFVDTVSGTRQRADLTQADVRKVRDTRGDMTPVVPTDFVANGYVDGSPTRWSRALKGTKSRHRPTVKDTNDLRHAAQRLRERVEGDTPEAVGDSAILPLVAFYGTERLRSGHRQIPRKKQREMTGVGRMSGYSGCLSSSSSVKDVIDWYETKMNEIRDPRFSAASPTKLIAAVERAMRVVLKPTGWCDLDWDSENRLLVVIHNEQGRLPLSALSDGVRNMVALVMDIARRCASLNPHLGEEAAQKTPGVLLIDELDLHLHPGWQQQIVDLLRKAFPSMQMVLSTHSPHVLSTVDMRSIRVIRLYDGQGVFEKPKSQTRGVESADVLMSIMHIDPVPQVKEARWLSDYRAIIEDGISETPKSQALRSKLTKHFGAEHPLMLDCDRLIRFQAFKRQRPRSEKG